MVGGEGAACVVRGGRGVCRVIVCVHVCEKR
jgi:hypothetical protein